MNEEPELLEDEEESDDLAVEGLSFFSGSSALELPLNDPAWDVFERADRAVSDRVWRIYLRQSGAERAPLERLPARAVVPVTTTTNTEIKGEKETMTAQPKKRGEMLEQTLEAYKKVEAHIGATPSASEVYAELGVAMGRSIENVRMAIKRLEQKGMLTRVDEQPPVPKKSTEKTFRRAADPVETETPVGPESASIDDPVLAALVAKRDALAAKVSALTAAIEAWQS